jgi:hypothetical protein
MSLVVGAPAKEKAAGSIPTAFEWSALRRLN